MAHGKDAARDLRYGRRGGGWQDVRAREALDAIAAARADARDAWPDPGRPARPEPQTVGEWRGLARMAHARQAAGHELDDRDLEALDLEALDHYPSCPPLLQPQPDAMAVAA